MSGVDVSALAGLPLDEIERTLAALVDHQRYNRIEFWTPYPKQQEFFALGKRFKERLLLAGNQLGKSDCGAYEVATHLTGLYPQDWEGYRYDGPNDWWAAGVSGKSKI